jgi:hypothetical protein
MPAELLSKLWTPVVVIILGVALYIVGFVPDWGIQNFCIHPIGRSGITFLGLLLVLFGSWLLLDIQLKLKFFIGSKYKKWRTSFIIFLLFLFLISVLVITLVDACGTSEPPIVSTEESKSTSTPTFTEEPTQTSTRTKTLTSTLTPTLTLTPTITPVVIFSDAFDNNGNDWLIDQIDNELFKTSQGINNGVLTFITDFKQDAVVWLQIPGIEQKNFQLTFDATIIELAPDTQTSIAIFFRRKVDQSYYVARYRSNGYFSLVATECLQLEFCYVPNENWTFSSSINLEENQTNTFKILVNNESFGFYINETLISEKIDHALKEKGYIGIGIYGAAESETNVNIDNVIVNEYP